MTLDIIFALFILLAMISGYIGGGFKEILKLDIFILIFVAFKIPSLENAIKEIAGPNFYTGLFIFLFLTAYLFIYKLTFFALRNLIKEKEGALGATNKIFGLIVGFFKGSAVIFVMIYIFDSLLKHHIFIELLPYTKNSMIYSITTFVLDKTGLFFF